MTFNELVHSKLDFIFRNYNLNVVDELTNYIRLKSKNIEIVVSYDEREHGGYLYAGKDEASLMNISSDIIKRFFVPFLDENFKIPEKTQEDFVNNIFSFFSNTGGLLLQGNDNLLQKIESSIRIENTKYTNDLIQEQNLITANNAWDKKDYSLFIECFHKIKNKKFLSTNQLKYNYALKRINKKD